VGKWAILLPDTSPRPIPLPKEAPGSGFRTQLLEVCHLPGVHLPKSLYPNLINPGFPSLPYQYVVVVL